MRLLTMILLLALALGLTGMLGPHPRYIEEMAVGGGYGDPVDGGAWHLRDGRILTDGSVTAAGGLRAGTYTGPSASMDVRTGDAHTAYYNLYKSDEENGGALWYDGSTDLMKLGTRADSTVPTAALEIARGSANAAVNGSLTIRGTTCHVGQQDTTRGTMNLYGGSGAGGGTINFWNGAADDDFTDRWILFAEPATGDFLLRAVAGPSGVTRDVFKIDDVDHRITVPTSLQVSGGEIEAGAPGNQRGVVSAWQGSGGSAPGCIRLASPDGSVWYLFIEDDGTVKVHDALPTSNSDGDVVGLQF